MISNCQVICLFRSLQEEICFSGRSPVFFMCEAQGLSFSGSSLLRKRLCFVETVIDLRKSARARSQAIGRKTRMMAIGHRRYLRVFIVFSFSLTVVQTLKSTEQQAARCRWVAWRFRTYTSYRILHLDNSAHTGREWVQSSPRHLWQSLSDACSSITVVAVLDLRQISPCTL